MLRRQYLHTNTDPEQYSSTTPAIIKPITVQQTLTPITTSTPSGDLKFSPVKVGVDRWGHRYWYVIHTAAFRYPEVPSDDEKMGMQNFITSIPYILPCSICSEHATGWLREHNHELAHALTSKYTLFQWLVEFHNSVNHRSGKKIYTVEEAWRKYQNNP